MIVRLKISDLLIDFDTRFPDYIRKRCAAYLVGSSPSAAEASSPMGTEKKSAPLGTEKAAAPLRLSVSDEDIQRSDSEHVGPEEAELYAMAIPLSEALPGLRRLMTHGVAISCDGRGFIFTARSGVGKSTHAFLWQKYLGSDRVRIINGDKPILWLREDGKVYACGSPWSGKEHLDRNVCVPLEGICLLHRLENSDEASPWQPRQPQQSQNAQQPRQPRNAQQPHLAKFSAPAILPASREEVLDFLLGQIFIPGAPDGMLRTLALIEELFDTVPFYHLYADISPEAVAVASRCLLRQEPDIAPLLPD